MQEPHDWPLQEMLTDISNHNIKVKWFLEHDKGTPLGVLKMLKKNLNLTCQKDYITFKC